ncbi:MAG: ribose-5-phosphate isomerase RpiA [Planctomycetota bacterium]
MTTAQHNPKEVSGRRAADLVEDGMVVGLGTGSTVAFTLDRLAERIRDEGLSIRGVPTSLDTERKAKALGIPLVTLDEVDGIDLTIDGADEVDGALNLTKGGGGALLREKVVAHASCTLVIVVGREKLVERLGTTFLLPVEVVPFARATVAREVRELGAEPILRMSEDGKPYLTDNGNQILDCRFAEGIESPELMELDLGCIPGVVESGLFVGMADVIVVGDREGNVELIESEV